MMPEDLKIKTWTHAMQDRNRISRILRITKLKTPLTTLNHKYLIHNRTSQLQVSRIMWMQYIFHRSKKIRLTGLPEKLTTFNPWEKLMKRRNLGRLKMIAITIVSKTVKSILMREVNYLLSTPKTKARHLTMRINKLSRLKILMRLRRPLNSLNLTTEEWLKRI